MQSDFCSWEGQEGAFAVRLRLRVVKWLGPQVIEGRQSSGTPGELGGILLGRTLLDAGKQAILIEGFLPVPCNYREGWHLSDKDKWFFKEQLGRWRFRPEEKLYAVGCYRGHIPADSGIGAQSLAQEFFANQAAVFLHIKQLPLETSVGGFLFRENGQIGRLPDLTFPFSRDIPPAGETAPAPMLTGTGPGELSPNLHAGQPENQDKEAPHTLDKPSFPAGAAAVVPDQSVAPPPSGSSPEQTVSAVKQSAPGPSPGKSWHSAATVLKGLNGVRVVSVGVLVLALGIGGYWIFRRTEDQSQRETSAVRGRMPLDRVVRRTGNQPDTAPSVATLGLEVAREKNLLHLKWNKDAALIASASGGILAIKDGSRQKDFYLDAPRLQGGSFDYAHRTGDVTFRLRVKGPEGDASEWIRVVGVDRSPSAASGERAAIKPHSRGWGTPESRREKDILVAGSKSTVPGRPTKPSSTRSKDVAAVAANALTPAVTVPNDEGTAGLEGAVRTGTADAPDANLPVTQGARPSSLAEAGVKTEESHRSVHEDDGVRLFSEPPGLIASKDTANSGERASQSIDPRRQLRITAYLAPGLRPLVPAGTKVEVKLYVDKSGKVVRADTVRKGDVNAHATKWALRTARELRFYPAQRDGRNVPSETVIQFDFPDELK